ncbi:MAG: dihydropteroate synthase [Vulcanibacillus sp.]
MKHNTRILCIKNREQLRTEMMLIGSDLAGINIMIPKGELIIVKVQDVSLKAAIILKQEMLAKNGEAVLNKGVSMLDNEISDVLLIGTSGQFIEIIKKLRIQPFGLKQIANEIELAIIRRQNVNSEKIINCNGIPLIIGKKTLIMGILNITPDSFSDGGKYNSIAEAISHAVRMVNEGADIIDIGGESTRPGHKPISIEEELKRVIPVVVELSKMISVPISVDTYKAEVAKRAIDAGAHMINDVWGLKKDKKMARTIAELGVPVILMHNREEPKYQSLIDDIIADLRESINIALEAGVDEKKIIIDPGIGFAKSYEENLIVMNRLEDIVTLGYPVLLGTSRKSLIGNTLKLPTNERIEGTIATFCYGITKGCKIIRVHDIKEMKKACNMIDKMNYLENKEGCNG